MSNLFFFWTSLWYLYFVIFLSLLISFFLNLRFSSSLYLFIFLSYLSLFLVFFIEIHNNINVSLFKNYFNFTLNKLLHNGTNKIHPFILYMSLTCFISKFFSWNYYFNITNKHILGTTVSNESYIYYRSLLLIFTALFLGAWWALQEGSWGGWWNWDISEIFGLVIFYKIIFILHSKLYMSSHYFNYWYNYITFFILIIFYLVMQINFELSAHDFGFKWIRFPTKEYTMYFIILLSLNILSLQVVKLYSILNMLNTNSPSAIPSKLVFLAVLINLILYINTILICVNLYSIKVLMEEKTVYSIDFSLITLVLVTLVVSTNIVNFTFHRYYLVLLNWYDVFTIFLLYSRTIFSNVFQKLIHFLIFFLFIYVFFNLTLITTHWASIVETSHKHYALNILPDSSKLEWLYNSINRGTKADIRTFKLSIKVNQLYQEFLPTYQYSEISMSSIDYTPVTMLSFCLFITYIYFLFLYQIIIF